MKFIVKGQVTDSNNNPLSNIFVQAMDSDQGFFEDHNDDLLGFCRTDTNGLFEIPFDDSTFADKWLENTAEVYLILRNESGQIIHRTEVVDLDKPLKITLESTEKKIISPVKDPYANNVDRILSSFRSLADVTTFRSNDFDRNFRLLLNSINAWLVYTNEIAWEEIGYDGPQVPRYPLQSPNHPHKLSWETSR